MPSDCASRVRRPTLFSISGRLHWLIERRLVERRSALWQRL